MKTCLAYASSQVTVGQQPPSDQIRMQEYAANVPNPAGGSDDFLMKTCLAYVQHPGGIDDVLLKECPAYTPIQCSVIDQILKECPAFVLSSGDAQTITASTVDDQNTISTEGSGVGLKQQCD